MYIKKDDVTVLSLTDHVWQVLEENNNNGNHFLNESEIAIRVMSNVLGRPEDKTLYGKVIQPKSIKSCMGSVRNLADVNGVTIVAERKFTDDNGKTLKGWLITGWRISTEEDEDYIKHEIQIRATMRKGSSEGIRKIEGRHPIQGQNAIKE